MSKELYELNIENIVIINNKVGITFYESITLNNTNYYISTRDIKNNYIMLTNDQ